MLLQHEKTDYCRDVLDKTITHTKTYTEIRDFK